MKNSAVQKANPSITPGNGKGRLVESVLGLRVLEYSDLESSHVEKGLENESSSSKDMNVLA